MAKDTMMAKETAATKQEAALKADPVVLVPMTRHMETLWRRGRELYDQIPGKWLSFEHLRWEGVRENFIRVVLQEITAAPQANSTIIQAVELSIYLSEEECESLKQSLAVAIAILQENSRGK